jgi:hypothetical protein
MSLSSVVYSPYFSQAAQPTESNSVRCPVTGKRFTAVGDWRSMAVQEQEGTWWKCPECRGWHITLDQHETGIVRALKKVRFF